MLITSTARTTICRRRRTIRRSTCSTTRRTRSSAQSGRIVCRSTLTNPNNGCVPLNLFGRGRLRPRRWTGSSARRWAIRPSSRTSSNVSVSGQPLAAVGRAALGRVRRRLSPRIQQHGRGSDLHLHASLHGRLQGFPAAIEGLLGGWERTNIQPIRGKYDVTEIFGGSAPAAAEGCSRCAVARPQPGRAAHRLQHERRCHHLESRPQLRSRSPPFACAARSPATFAPRISPSCSRARAWGRAT